MKISVSLLSLLLVFFAGFAHAQVEQTDVQSEAEQLDELIITTPRDMVIEGLRGLQDTDSVPELTDETSPASDSETVIEIFEPETVTEPEEAQEEEPVAEIVGLEEEPQEEPAEEEKSKEEADEEQPLPLAPFYLNARDYVQLRGSENRSQLTLTYKITTTDAAGETIGTPQAAALSIGTDYVSISSVNTQKIFDFKLNRVLEIKPSLTLSGDKQATTIFDNVSLYAKAYRNMKTVLGATENGSKRQIQISEEDEIDAFWLESSMSWAAAPLETPPSFEKDDSAINAMYGDQAVFSAKFSEEKFESPAFKNALFAYAHHDWPLHPSILLAIYAYDAPPARMEILSYGPRYPKGQKQRWELKDRSFSDEADFPLPLDALSVTERRQVSPLVFIIHEAANNRALGGIQSAEQIEGAFETALEAEDNRAQWLAGQKYKSYTGACKAEDENWLCAALADLIETNKFSSISEFDPDSKKLSDYISAVEMAKDKKARGTALHTLQPYLDDPDVPAIVLRTAAMARAGMKKSAASSLGLYTIQADALLKRALAIDPYDPQTYLGLAQVYAASGAYEQSWDVYDALRSAIPTAAAVDHKIDIVEAKLKDNAAGYFLVE